MFGALFFLVVSAKFYFHLHHYLVALFLWPLTGLNHGLCLFVQGGLAGLFINGASRWGFDSLFEAKPLTYYLPPAPVNVTASLIDSTSGLLSWSLQPSLLSLEEPVFSVWLNGLLELYRGLNSSVLLSGLFPENRYLLCVRTLYDGVLGPCSKIVNITTGG